MEYLFSNFSGIALAFLGASLAAGLCCVGSAKGVGMVGEAAAGLLSDDPSRFASCMILQILPGTQGLYGFVIWFMVMNKIGLMGGSMVEVSTTAGWALLMACLPMMLGGLISAKAQARVAAAGVSLMAKQPKEMIKGVMMAVMVEFYAIISLLTSILMIMNLKL